MYDSCPCFTLESGVVSLSNYMCFGCLTAKFSSCLKAGMKGGLALRDIAKSTEYEKVSWPSWDCGPPFGPNTQPIFRVSKEYQPR